MNTLHDFASPDGVALAPSEFCVRCRRAADAAAQARRGPGRYASTGGIGFWGSLRSAMFGGGGSAPAAQAAASGDGDTANAGVAAVAAVVGASLRRPCAVALR